MADVALTLQIGNPGNEAWVSRREYVTWPIAPRRGDSILHKTLLYEVLAVRHDLDKPEVIVNLWPSACRHQSTQPEAAEVISTVVRLL